MAAPAHLHLATQFHFLSFSSSFHLPPRPRRLFLLDKLLQPRLHELQLRAQIGKARIGQPFPNDLQRGLVARR